MLDGAEIVAAQTDQTGRSDSPAFLFFPEVVNRAKALTIARQQFNHILAATSLKQDYEGNARTLCSLRHYAIQRRLRDSGGNVNLYALATNAGTSIEMLERFYLAKMALNDEMVKNLHHDAKAEAAKKAVESQLARENDRIVPTIKAALGPLTVKRNPQQPATDHAAKAVLSDETMKTLLHYAKSEAARKAAED